MIQFCLPAYLVCLIHCQVIVIPWRYNATATCSKGVLKFNIALMDCLLLSDSAVKSIQSKEPTTLPRGFDLKCWHRSPCSQNIHFHFPEGHYKELMKRAEMHPFPFMRPKSVVLVSEEKWCTHRTPIRLSERCSGAAPACMPSFGNLFSVHSAVVMLLLGGGGGKSISPRWTTNKIDSVRTSGIHHHYLINAAFYH